MKKFNFIATTTFGLESTVKREVQNLGFENIKVQDGRVEFTGDLKDMARANIYLGGADRVLLKLAEFKALEFEDIFQAVKKIDWAYYMPQDANFVVTGKSVKSKLSSVPACQSVTEKAIVEKMKETYKLSIFPKSGAKYKVLISILKDTAIITIDTSGEGLHKRGYREVSVKAPLKETLAYSLIELSYWKKDRVLLDPVCGSGTIAIEAAMKAKNIAPGLARKFVSETWSFSDPQVWKDVRAEAYSKIDVDFIPKIYASDIDPKNIEIAKENAYNAGVDDCITFECKPFREVTLPEQYGVTICNPPYGERIGILKDVEDLYRDMGKLYQADPTWSFYCITSHEEFERIYGKRADQKRKLYNGMIKIDYFQYYGLRPPRKENK